MTCSILNGLDAYHDSGRQEIPRTVMVDDDLDRISRRTEVRLHVFRALDGLHGLRSVFQAPEGELELGGWVSDGEQDQEDRATGDHRTPHDAQRQSVPDVASIGAQEALRDDAEAIDLPA